MGSTTLTAAAQTPGSGGGGGVSSYNDLTDKPTIPTTLPASDVSAWAKAGTKPAYTKSEIGLSNVDNTADASKPVSTAQQTALNLKLDNNEIAAPTIRPSLLLDFANAKSLDPRITFTRASTATRVNEKGLIELVASDKPRFDHDTVTGACKGLLIEEQRVNILLNSEALATQSVTTTAASWTLTFYGAGTVVLSGTHSATIVGDGVFPARKTTTFTPTAGTLTLTVTGSVTQAQLEVGSFATSYIPTAASQATRIADNAQITGTNFSSWYRQDEGTVLAKSSFIGVAAVSQVVCSFDNGGGDRHILYRTIGKNIVTQVDIAGSVLASPTGSLIENGVVFMSAYTYKLNDLIVSYNGATGIAGTSLTLPVATRLQIGDFISVRTLNGHISKLAYYPKRLSNLELQTLSTQ